MIEQAMIFALGFMIAGLIALVIAPAFWHRALRLSTRRLEMLVPLSTREILAERDLLRAEFAIDRRRFEQKEASLNRLRAADMAELGRRTAAVVGKDDELIELSRRHAEQGAALSASERALADAAGQLAATSSALYGQIGLVERKDADLQRLRDSLAALQTHANMQSISLTAFEEQVAQQKGKLAREADEIARLRLELSSLGLERDADVATLKATAMRLADREEALKGAEMREVELLRRRKRLIETSRAIERRMVEKTDRLRAEKAAAQKELDAARTDAESLAREMTGLRRLNAMRDATPLSAEREENAILRQNINEIGAAIIRMAKGSAGLALEPAAAHQDGRDKPTDAKPAARAGEKRTPPARPTRA
ncbi:MAG: hypothetical protein WDN46_25255 [Methylocella sp.]